MSVRAGAAKFPSCLGPRGCPSLGLPMKAHPQSSLTTRVASWYALAANRDVVGRAVINGA
jgi:hypothetical protein